MTAKEVVRRQISLEFETLEGISHYEVELTLTAASKQKKRPALFKVKNGIFNAKIEPGVYQIRQRSVDDRGVPGEWSEPTPITVPFPTVELVSPRSQEVIKTDEPKSEKVTFRWQQISGAETYRIEVLQADGNPIATNEVDKTEVEIDLPVAATYTWRVTVTAPEPQGEKSETPTAFQVLGAPLDPPGITIKKTKSGFEAVEWTHSPQSTQYQVKILKEKNGDWQEVQSVTSKATQIKPLPNWTKGRYKAAIQAEAPLRSPSSVVEKEFEFEGYLTPKQKTELAKQIEVKESQRLPTNWYAVASYLLTNMSYSGSSRESDTQTNFNAIGGTGRLGLGHQKHTDQWGALGIVDLSGFIIDKVRYQFASSELLATWMPFENDQLKILGGLYYKELPASVGSRVASSGGVEKVSYLGPTAQVQFHQPLNARLGFALLGQGYLSALKVKTPNDRAVKPNLSYQGGLLGTLRLSPTVLGYAGYVYRVDTISWEATPFDESNPTASFANPGELNTVTVKGGYINFILNVAF